ncbi:MAG: PQQ-dependent sugar dehydrogenase [Bacteroidetes bacterium]|nr:PQQ-dependent sugar dehydrogenase [Bacteroidota bacterium]
MKNQNLLYKVNQFKRTRSLNPLFKHFHTRSGIVLCLLIILEFSFLKAGAQIYPSGFSQVQVALGLTNPTIMQFAPDGRLFIAQQNGILRVFKNGSMLTKPFITVPVNFSGERGLLGIAFDPAFASNKFIYLYYTLSSGANNRISRFTASGDTVIPGSEVLVLNLDPLSTATNHNGGTMQFGPDGKLYVGVGENANSANAQNLDTYLGKILRINADGTPAAGNPFPTGSVQRRSVWEYGMRNPYTITFQPGTGKLFVNDVGQNAWEEINDCTIGGLNYGWPAAEGMSTNTLYTNPVYTYGHGSGIGLGCAITGGTFFNPTTTNYPSTYTGNYFFIDYCGNWIDRIAISGSTVTRSNFASSIAGFPVGLISGPDGNLYFLSRTNSSLCKIVYTTSTAPQITSQPQSITVAQGNPATFTVTVTGTAPITYQWKKGTTIIGGATSSVYTIPTVVPGDAGTYTVTASNAAGTATSSGAVLTVTSPNQVPVAGITTPAVGAFYSAGTTLSFSGTGNDNEDGVLPATAFEWYVDFHHDTHIHPGPSAPDGVKSGSFSIPNTGETAANVYYRLFLVVTDSQGAKDTVYTDINPNTSTITLNTNPQGLQITLDGQPFTAPITVSSVEGMLRAISATSPQTINTALTYNYSSWSQGGTQTQTFATPVSNVSYTANYTAALRSPENPTTTIQGLNYSYFQGTWSALPNFAALTPVSSGVVSTFDISPRSQNDNFGFRFTGYINVPASGVYTFYSSSDDGSKVYIGTTLVVNNDGLHANLEASGQIGLLAGKHAITVDFIEQAGAEVLSVSYLGPTLAKQIIPASALFVAPQTLTRNPVADAYVRGGNNANTNYGSSSRLYTKKGTNSNSYESYLRFDISAIPGNVSSAKLRLYSKISSTGVASIPVEVLNVSSNTWQESTINYTNKPIASGTALATVSITGTTSRYYDWDITQQVNALRNAGITSISLLVRNTVTSSGSSRIQINSKEAGSNKPILSIVSTSLRISDEESSEQIAVPLSGIPDFTVYPQPAHDYISLVVPEEYQSSILRIYDLNGKWVRSIQLEGSTEQQISIGDLEKGIYLFSIDNGSSILRKKVIIQ